MQSLDFTALCEGSRHFMDFHKLMPKEEKGLLSLLIAEKLFTHVSRSRMAGSISPVQRGLLRKRLLRSPRGDFIWKKVQKAKSDLRGCFQAR